MPDLPEDQRAVLEFEEAWTRHAGHKAELIRDTFDMSPARYYQVLNHVLDDPIAEASMPMVVHRLRRARAERLDARRDRRFGHAGS